MKKHLLNGNLNCRESYRPFGIRWLSNLFFFKKTFFLFSQELNIKVFILVKMQYKSPKITVDGVILTDGKILLVKRKNSPFKNKWALPGGFVEYGETTETAILREIFEETGLKTKIRNLSGVYSDPDRDPRGHTVSVVYAMEKIEGELKYGDDAIDVKFFDLGDLPCLAFDHYKIIKEVIGGD